MVKNIIKLVSYGLIAIGGLIAVYHLLAVPATAITAVSFAATGFIGLAVNKWFLK